MYLFNSEISLNEKIVYCKVFRNPVFLIETEEIVPQH